MSRRAFRIAPALALVLFLGACERAAEPPAGATPVPGVDSRDPATPETDPPDAADAIDATHVVDHAPVAGADAGFDVRAFAGSFEGGGLRLDLAPDGTYAAATDAGIATGTWSVEADSARIRLDPDSKDEADRVYGLVSADELVSDGDAQLLRRSGD